MPHKMFVQPYQNGPLGYLIALPKAVYILLKHKFRDARVQFFLVQWAGALLVMLGVGICAFTLMPTLIAAGFFAPMTCFFAFLVWLAAGDMFFKFAVEDESFYKLATERHALSVFLDTDRLPFPRGHELSNKPGQSSHREFCTTPVEHLSSRPPATSELTAAGRIRAQYGPGFAGCITFGVNVGQAPGSIRPLGPHHVSNGRLP
jgi:hypothetical protein